MQMRKALYLLLALAPLSVSAQLTLSLDSCRAMALRGNKQMSVQQLKQDMAADIRRSARTKYLPHVSAIGTYQYTSKPVSLLSGTTQAELSGLGSSLAPALGALTQSLPIPIDPQVGAGIAGALNGVGQKIVDAFDTDTRNLFAGAVMVTQPLFLGGSIVAMNHMADINEQMAADQADFSRQTVIYAVDQAYWQVVSLKNKQQLAESYLQLVQKLDGDVQKMIREGVATRSDGLSVNVRVNEAEMTLQKVNDGLVLSRMLLCQMIGLPMDSDITLADEGNEELRMKNEEFPAGFPTSNGAAKEYSFENRPELRLLEHAVDLSRQTTNLLRAGNLPQLLLTGGYAVSNPNVLDGFQRKFSGFWNVGLMLRIPLWNWGDVMYKVRASKGATAIANLELEEAREKIELQVNQSSFRVNEAGKRLIMAQASIDRANENLRVANIGFSEGVITPTTVMEAQTAWLQAQTQLIDAQIDARMSQVELQKALGTLTTE